MPTLAFRFLAGRYHATPWGDHVNEGHIEWPPSPWRLLRALLCTGFTTLGWPEDDLPGAARDLVHTLATCLPTYRLPEQVSTAHTRHFMPIKEKTAKVLDTFVRLSPDDPLLVHWPAELPTTSAELLEKLCHNLGYLGRAEAWVEARIIDSDFRPNCVPTHDGPPEPGGEQLSLLAPLTDAVYQPWRAQALVEDLEHATQELAKGKKLTKNKASAIHDRYPLEVLECLLARTSWLHQHRWSQPPGSRRVVYTRPVGALDARPRTRVRLPRPEPVGELPVMSLLTLRSDTERTEVLPSLFETLPLCERLHRYLAKMLGEGSCEGLTGRAATGAKTTADHRHIHYLPLTTAAVFGQDRGRAQQTIEHLLLYMPGGFGRAARQVIDRVSHLHYVAGRRGNDHAQRQQGPTSSGRDPGALFVSPAGFGGYDELRHAVGTELAQGLAGRGHTWVSYTPYVAAHYLKRKSIVRDLTRLLQRELQWRGVEARCEVEILPLGETGFIEFSRRRHRNRPQPPSPTPWNLQLHFDRPIDGPLALGYGSHFGLGIFRHEARELTARERSFIDGRRL